MIITKLKGGLGNQMFQYAAARGIKEKEERIVFDLSYLEANSLSTNSFTARNFEIHIFKNIKFKSANKYLLNFILSYKIYFRIIRAILFFRTEKICQKENELVSTSNIKSNSIYLDGYFQSEKYFKHIREKLILEFTFPPLDEANLFQSNKINSFADPVCIHVRRGDYLKPSILEYHGVLPLTYYKEAIKIITTSVNNPHFFIFSNDFDWCKENFSFLGDQVTFLKPNNSENAWKDMYLMTQCRHHIVANSSFSWWGAWLSQKSGTNLAPSNWFNPKVAKFNITDFIPSSWQIVYYD